MVMSTEPAWGEVTDAFVTEFDDAVVYADVDSETVLHEGSVRILANGWVELSTGRMLSPNVVHHVDHTPDPDR